MIKATKVLYIKLGRNGIWEKDCIEKSQTIRLGYREVNHEDCLAGKWDSVRKSMASVRQDKKTLTSDVNQIRDYYETDKNVLWITFYAGRMWWCFSKPKITKLKDGSKTRPVVGEWQSTDINGQELRLDNLRGNLTKVQAFRGTLCKVKEDDYAIKRINGEQQADVKEAKVAVKNLEEKIKPLVKGLPWKDFETLIDLIFRNAGWQRVGEVGKTTKTLDLELFSPVTKERYMVQIKSESNPTEFKKYCNEFRNYKGYQKFFYVVHSPTNSKVFTEEKNVTLWLLDDITKHVINSGLVEWLIAKSS